MDECTGSTAYDASGNGNNGTIYPVTLGNTATGTCASGTTTEMWNDGTSGKFNSSLGFDGTDDYVQKSSPSGLSSTDGALGAWVNVTSLPTDYGVITGVFENSADADQIYIGALNVSSTLRFVIVRRTAATTRAVAYTNNSFTLGAWYHVTATGGTGGDVLYINGIPQSLTYSSGASSAEWTSAITNSYFMAGARQFNSTPEKYLNGLIDDVRIYNYALTANQVKNIMNEGSAVRFGPASGTP